MPKKKHFYHKGNFEYEIDAKTPIEIIMEIKKESLTEKQEAWLVYLNQTGYYRKSYNTENPEQDLSNILGMFTVNSQDIVNQIITESMSIEGYRPWLGHEIPLDKYPEDMANLIRKRQKQFLAEYCYRKEVGEVLVQSYHPEMFFDHDMQLQIYDCVILLRGDSRIIYSNNNEALVKYLNFIDDNSWEVDEEQVYKFANLVNIKKSRIDFKNQEDVEKIGEMLSWQDN